MVETAISEARIFNRDALRLDPPCLLNSPFPGVKAIKPPHIRACRINKNRERLVI